MESLNVTTDHPNVFEWGVAMRFLSCAVALIFFATVDSTAQEGGDTLTWIELRALEPVTSISDALQNPDAVISLHLKEQPISSDDFQAIGRLRNLQMLLLNSNDLTAINPIVFTLENLRVLDVSFNLIEEVPEEIGQLRNLESLAIFKNQIKTLPTSLGTITGFNGTYMGQNPDLDVAQTIEVLAQLPNLQYLGYGGRMMGTLPDSISKLSSLTDLFLANNGLQEFPRSLLEITTLKYLTLSHNQIPAIPEDIERLKNLKGLALAGNPLAEDDREFSFRLVK